MFNKCISVFAVLMLLILTGCGGGSSKPKVADVVDDEDDAKKAEKPKTDAPKKEKAAGGGAGVAYDPATATATIKGVVSLEGEAPKMGKLPVADAACAEHRKTGNMDALAREDVVVKDGKIANVVVYVSKGAEKYSFDGLKMDNALIDQHGCQYSPHVLALKVDQKLDIKSSDPIAHNIHILYEGAEVNISQTGPGIHSSHPSFGEARMGVMVKCDVHAWMKSFMNVFDHPFFYVTKDDGKFELKLPPGDYEISTWQESAAAGKLITAPEPQKVTVTADKPAELNLTFKTK